jgi:hypothetical protein
MGGSSSDGDRSIVVQEFMIAMRSASELVSRNQTHGQPQHDNDMRVVRGMLEASEARCATLSQQIQQQQQMQQQQTNQNQQLVEDIRRANTLLQASESRSTALAKQLQVCVHFTRCWAPSHPSAADAAASCRGV